MKKYLVVLAALAMVLVGCKDKDKDGGSEYTKISIKQSEITLAAGETYKLNLLYEPTTLDAPACTWSSSNAEVATVDNGTVTAVAPGEATITAKFGELSAACKVIVKTVYGAYEIEDYSIFGSAPSSWVEGSDTTINLSWAGGKFHCRLGYWIMLAWDGNVTYGTEGLEGEGFLLFDSIPFYTIEDETAGEYNGTPFGWGSFRIADTNGAVVNNYGHAGKLVEDIYKEYIDSYVTYLITKEGKPNFDLFDQAISGASIFLADYVSDPEEPAWYIDYGLISALVKDMTLIWDGDTESFSYQADIDWFNNLDEDRYFGVKVDESGTVKPYDLDIISEHYATGDFAEADNAPAFTEPKMITKRHKEIPEIRIGRKVANDILIKK